MYIHTHVYVYVYLYTYIVYICIYVFACVYIAYLILPPCQITIRFDFSKYIYFAMYVDVSNMKNYSFHLSNHGKHPGKGGGRKCSYTFLFD
jgi:hypothetical protein